MVHEQMNLLARVCVERELSDIHTEEIRKLLERVNLEDHPFFDKYLRLDELIDILLESSGLIVFKRGAKVDYKVNHRDDIRGKVYEALLNVYINNMD